MSAIAFDPQDIERLSGLGLAKAYPKNTVLIQEGDYRDQIFTLCPAS